MATIFLKKQLYLQGGQILLNQNLVSPVYTQWNIDGWADLSNITTRTYGNWVDIISENPPDYVGTEAIMYDTLNNLYYKVMFTKWTQGAVGGGFAYWRQQIIFPGSLGPIVYFEKTDYGNEIDYIDNNVAITRSVNRGIYNPLFESFYNGNPQPQVKYNLILPPIFNQGNKTALDNNTIEECYITHAQPGSAQFYLPLIQTMKGAINPKIYITNSLRGKVSVYPAITAPRNVSGGTTINGTTAIGINPGKTTYFHAVSPSLYLGLTAF